MPIRPSLILKAPDGQPAVGNTLGIPAEGLALTLEVPAVAPARLELTEASLTLAAPTGTEATTDLKGGDAGLTVTTNLGALSAGWAEEKARDVTWLIADWGERRPLVALQVDSTAALDPNQARLRISEGTVWFPAQSVDTVPFNAERSLPDVVASRLMLEVVAPGEGGVLQPAKGHLSGLTVKLGAQPHDVSVSVGTQPPVFERPGRLVAGQQARVEDGLLAALNRAMPADGKAARTPLVIRDALRGKVTVAAARFSALLVYTALDAAQASLPLGWRGEAVGRVTVGDGSPLREVGFTLVPELLPQRFLVEGRLEEAAPHARLGAARHATAQGFPGLGAETLVGVDVLLRPLAPRTVGMLALHPEAHGLPGEAPYTGAQVAFELLATGERPWAPRFVSVELPGPVRLPERWWLVLTVAEGEALWPLSTAVPEVAGGLGPVLGRRAGGAWSEWEPPPEKAWALARLRVARMDAPPLFEVELRRGAKQLTVRPSGGRVALSADALAPLGTEGAVLEVRARSTGAPVAGALRLEGLRVAVREPG